MKHRFRRLFRAPASIRTRLMLWNIGTVALLLLVLGGIVQYSVQTLLLVSVDRELVHRARPFGGPPPPHGDGGPPNREGGPPREQRPEGRPPADGGAGQDRSPMPAPPGGEPPGFPREERMRIGSVVRKDMGRRRGGDFFPRILQPDGKDMFQPDRVTALDMAALRRALKGSRQFTTVELHGEPVRVLSDPVLRDGRVAAVAQIPYPLSDIYRSINGIRTILLALLPVALILAGLGGAIVTGRATRPVRDIVQAAERIGAHDLGQRLTVTGRDEFSHLAATFNNMLGRLERAFAKERTLVQRLERALAQQQRFTADASHELKTPLTVAKVNASLLLRCAAPDDEYRESLQDIDRSIDAMGRLVQDLLLLARHDAGQATRASTDVMLRDVLLQARSSVTAPGIAPIRIDVDDPTLAVYGNEGDLVRVFSNLFDNAVHYTPATGEIRATAAVQGEAVLVHVTDTGPGVSPEHLAHLGERFYRVDASRARPDGGTGLGLSICKSIVEGMGGGIGFESAPGSGLTVSVRLPVAGTVDAPEDIGENEDTGPA